MNAPFPGLELLNISHSHSSKTVVKDFSLTVPSGSLTCLLGPSGCGKTTVLRLSAGLERLQVGSIRVDGVHVADKTGGLPPEQRGVGLMFQDYALFPHLDVLRNVSFGLNRLPAESRQIAAKEAQFQPFTQLGLIGQQLAQIQPGAFATQTVGPAAAGPTPSPMSQFLGGAAGAAGIMGKLGIFG